LHSSWKFNGLAGLVTLLTLVIVVSGFIGRYIYTAVPRTMEGVELDESMLAQRITLAENQIGAWLQANQQAAPALASLATASQGVGGQPLVILLETPWRIWQRKHSWRKARRHMNASIRHQADQLEGLIRQRNLLRRQIASLAMARRSLAVWHTVHVPIGLALFTAAFIHIGAAIYYATLLR
jgi:hypothetical protein